jgi:hypothetical protein
MSRAKNTAVMAAALQRRLVERAQRERRLLTASEVRAYETLERTKAMGERRDSIMRRHDVQSHRPLRRAGAREATHRADARRSLIL